MVRSNAVVVVKEVMMLGANTTLVWWVECDPPVLVVPRCQETTGDDCRGRAWPAASARPQRQKKQESDFICTLLCMLFIGACLCSLEGRLFSTCWEPPATQRTVFARVSCQEDSACVLFQCLMLTIRIIFAWICMFRCFFDCILFRSGGRIAGFSTLCSLFLFSCHYVYTITGSRSGPAPCAKEPRVKGQRQSAVQYQDIVHLTLVALVCHPSPVYSLQRFIVCPGHAKSPSPRLGKKTLLAYERARISTNPSWPFLGTRCVSALGFVTKRSFFFFLLIVSFVSFHFAFCEVLFSFDCIVLDEIVELLWWKC